MLIRILVTYGADIWVEDSEGRTPYSLITDPQLQEMIKRECSSECLKLGGVCCCDESECPNDAGQPNFHCAILSEKITKSGALSHTRAENGWMN